MTYIDLDALTAALDPDERGGRRHVDEIAAAIRILAPHVEAAAVSQLVLDTITRGEQDGRWTAARRTTVRRGRTTLPRSILLPRTAVADSRLKLLDVPLRSELAPWAAALRLSGPQRDLLIAVNDWLRRTNGGQVPIVAAAERAYELVRDEKAFDSIPPRGGTTLWRPGRLTFELLRCEHIATPLTWEPATTSVGNPGPVVCVENHATFRTLLRLLRARAQPTWVAVAWVQGRNTAPLRSLADLPFKVTRLDYLGDLDPAGLQIAEAACATAQSVGIPAGPAEALWRLLLRQPARPGRQIDDTDAAKLAAWLPPSVRRRAQAVLATGTAIPQEALRLDVIADAL